MWPSGCSCGRNNFSGVHMFLGLLTIIGGIIAASALIIARKPNAKELIDKLTPYQGWFGVGMFFWGIWNVILSVLNLGLLGSHPLIWIVCTTVSAANLAVGFLLGFGLITKYTLGASPVAQVRGQQIRARLAAFQGPIGLIAIASGVAYMLLLLTL